MSTPPISFRFPFESQIANLPPEVQMVHRNTWNAITDLQTAIPLLKGQIDTNKTAITAAAAPTANTTTSSQTVIVSGSTIGLVNNQVGVTSYSTLPSDNGAFILLGDSSPIAVTLNGLGSGEGIVLPFFCWILNFGTATATLTPDSGDINNAANYSLESNNGIVLSYDGVNFWAEPTSPEPQNTPAIAHKWLNSYDSATGAFGQTQPAFTDISGVAATDQIGTGTPSAGEYVDGGTGAWTALPSSPTVLNVNIQTANYAALSTDQIIQMNAAGATTVTLPTTSVTTGQVYYVKNVGAGTCTVLGATGNIDSHASIAITQWQTYGFYWDGSIWHQLSQSLSV